MKLTNMEALRAQGALSKLMEMDLPVKVSLDIAIISNMVDSRVKAYGAVLQSLYKKHSVVGKPKEGGGIQFICSLKGESEEVTEKLRTENLEAFSEKLNSLLEANTEDLTFRKIQLPIEIDGKPLQIKPEVLKALTEFVEII